MASLPLRLTFPLLTLGAMNLVACAPAQTGQTQTGQTQTGQTQTTPAPVSSTAAVFVPGGQQLAVICAGHGRVAAGGNLVWDSGQTQQHPVRLSRPAPYLLACYDFTVRNDGHTLSVQDDTLQKALTHFDPDAGFLHYFPGLSVTFPRPGLVGADPAESLQGDQRAALAGVTVLVSQAGQLDAALVQNGAVTARRFDPARPLILRFSGAAFAWPEVTVEAGKGRVTAPVGF